MQITLPANTSLSRTKEYRQKYQKLWYEKNKELCKQRTRATYWKNPEKQKAQHKERYKKDKEKYKNLDLKRRFGITIEEYKQMLIIQDNKCAICSQVDPIRALAVDHCHYTDRVRGLLCTNCNNGLGRFKDNIINLEKAIKYLCRK